LVLKKLIVVIFLVILYFLESVKYKIKDLNAAIQNETLNDDYVELRACVTHFDLDFSEQSKLIQRRW
jgi:hypothetical protein